MNLHRVWLDPSPASWMPWCAKHNRWHRECIHGITVKSTDRFPVARLH